MSTNTVDTMPTTETVTTETVTTETVTTAEALSAAVAAVSATADTDDTARGTLAAAALARYTVHAAKHLRWVDGVQVLPDNKKKDVAAMVWLDGTGSPFPVTFKDRTPGEVSLGQYLSRYHKVATDLIIGAQALCDVATANATYKGICDANKKAADTKKETEHAAAELKDRDAFKVWLTTQNKRTQTAYADVLHSLSHDGEPHTGGFLVALSEARIARDAAKGNK